jgi:hypothetical protein
MILSLMKSSSKSSLLCVSVIRSRRFLALAPRIDPLFIDYKSNTRLKQFNSALTKNIKNIQKKISDDLDDELIATSSAVIQARGFDIAWNENESILCLEKKGEFGEDIHVSIYEEVSLLLPSSPSSNDPLCQDNQNVIQVRILKANKPAPVTIHCVEENEQLALVTIEVTNLETSDAYGCPNFDNLDDPIKV